MGRWSKSSSLTSQPAGFNRSSEHNALAAGGATKCGGSPCPGCLEKGGIRGGVACYAPNQRRGRWPRDSKACTLEEETMKTTLRYLVITIVALATIPFLADLRLPF